MTHRKKLSLSACAAAAGLLTLAATVLSACSGQGRIAAEEPRAVTDASSRTVQVPRQVERVICSGGGSLRLLTYLGAHDRIVAVDSIEVGGSPIDARPYAVANPRFRTYPVFGEFRGNDNPELILGLDPAPQVIFKSVGGRGMSPDTLKAKTGIPVVVVDQGNLTFGRKRLENTLRLMAEVLGTHQRAAEIVKFFDLLEQDLRRRTAGIEADKIPSCYVGGIGQSGPHGFRSTEPSFAPFEFLGCKNVAALHDGKGDSSHAVVSMENILMWDPDCVFVDMSTLRLGPGASALDQLKDEPVFRKLSAVRAGRVYGLFPYNSYNQNFEVVFANAYYVGKVLHPERFADIDPMAKAEEISSFLNGGPAFAELNGRFLNLCFTALDVG